ncbi:LpxI family protein [Planktotalea arctica]|uniref:LpxI family protein n=1 Tax=Planktotalea arctica TaxID=1481893 RepID=UPI000A175ACA|nr:UDP-2,3-diacylglucosamine diphosphatase LpxI [Planktotalea arctica]
MGRLAILAGGGNLPRRLAALCPDAVQITFKGVTHGLGGSAQEQSYEKMGALFAALKSQGVSEVVMAGAMSRPDLDPAAFDDTMKALAPRLMAAMSQGDDALLRLVIAIFEEQGFAVRGAHEIDPSLTAAAGCLSGNALDARARADADRAIDILTALGPLDVGQGAVVENGLCLGIETLQGTDALLGFVANTPKHLRKGGGVFVKAPKRGQDLRVDMPTIGPGTVKAAALSGLSAIVLAARSVILLEREETLKCAEAHGITLIAQEI